MKTHELVPQNGLVIMVSDTYKEPNNPGRCLNCQHRRSAHGDATCDVDACVCTEFTPDARQV